jgi:hypothetical protein
MKTIQPKQKLGLSSSANLSAGRNRSCESEKMFWEMIDQIREEELGSLDPQSAEVGPRSKEPAGNRQRFCVWASKTDKEE